MIFKPVRFEHKDRADFFITLRERVGKHFKQHNISQKANRKMVIKTIFMLALYLVPFFFILSDVSSTAIFLLLWFIMGLGMAGIGLSIMHDANHGAYSDNKKVNTFLGRLLDFVGGSAVNWKIQHNVLHHTYTNIDGLDEDIGHDKFFRCSPKNKFHKYHRYQHYYAWFFYSLMSLFWSIAKDIKQTIRYNKMGLLKGQGTTFKKEITWLIFQKIFYFSYIIVLPLFLTSISFAYILLGFVIMHLTAGLILGCIFQPAHVMETCEFPMPKDGKIENNWAIHQFLNTTNFAPDSKIFSWLVGGLNFQIEHHLFPGICHVHYKDISVIVKQTAQEYGVPYYSKPTFLGALWDHAKMLKLLGTGITK